MKLSDKIKQHQEQFFELVSNCQFTHHDKKIDITDWMDQALFYLANLYKNRGRIFLIGNGASCSMASHFAMDFTKNASINAFSSNEGTMLTCFSNDYSYETAYQEIIKRYMQPADLLIAISSSGRSKNILNAVSYVNQHIPKSRVITLSGFNCRNSLRRMGNLNLFINICNYGLVESCHSYYLHLLVDTLVQQQQEMS
jgi:D-sedoheptulose 7-phosphate isomerase